MKTFNQFINEQVDSKSPYYNKLEKMLKFLDGKKNILFLTTSNRSEESKDEPKSTKLAKDIQKYLGKDKCTLIEVPELNIYPCEGHVSDAGGNICGVKDALLKDKEKNPTNYHRCWVSLDDKDDEVWKISKVLFESDCVVFFGSVRWGQMNSYYQKLIERLTWLENRHCSLGESNLLQDISAGIVVLGHNWGSEEVVDVQKKVLEFFGFDVKNELIWSWEYTEDSKDETLSGYKKAIKDFVTQIMNVLNKIIKTKKKE